MTSATDTKPPEPSLTEIFNAFAKKAVTDFPQLENRFAVYNAPADTLHGSFPDEDHQRLLASQQEIVADFFQKYTSKPHSFAWAGGGYNFIDYIEKGMNRHNYRTSSDPFEREVSAGMEHELAYIVAPGAGA